MYCRACAASRIGYPSNSNECKASEPVRGCNIKCRFQLLNDVTTCYNKTVQYGWGYKTTQHIPTPNTEIVRGSGVQEIHLPECLRAEVEHHIESPQSHIQSLPLPPKKHQEAPCQHRWNSLQLPSSCARTHVFLRVESFQDLFSGRALEILQALTETRLARKTNCPTLRLPAKHGWKIPPLSSMIIPAISLHLQGISPFYIAMFGS